MTHCTDCGAAVVNGVPICLERWHQLLALDHQRVQPFGKLHAVTFATYSLQHASGATDATLRRSLSILLHYLEAKPLAAALRAEPPLPKRRPQSFAVTLAEFDEAHYEEWLLEWARSTILAWNPSR